MATFGEKLRQERKSRGIGLREIANATKIARHHLDALERNDLRSLPGGTFNKGYVRQYAKYLGLDEEAVVQAYLIEEHAQGIEAPSGEEIAEDISRAVDARGSSEGGARRGFDTRKAVLVGLLAVLAAAIGWLILRPGSSQPDASLSGSAGPALSRPAATPAVAPDGTSAQPAPPTASPASREEPPEEGAGGGTGPAASPAGPDADRPSPGEPAPARASPSGSAATPRQEPEPRPSAAARPEARDASSSGAPATGAGPEPAGEPVAGTSAPEASSATTMSVSASGVGTDVVDHQLVGESDAFPVGTRVYFWNRVVGGRPGEVVRHVWIHEGRPVETIELRIGGPSWRTHSLKTMFAGSAGAWTVEARTEDGATLARQSFRCLP